MCSLVMFLFDDPAKNKTSNCLLSRFLEIAELCSVELRTYMNRLNRCCISGIMQFMFNLYPSGKAVPSTYVSIKQ